MTIRKNETREEYLARCRARELLRRSNPKDIERRKKYELARRNRPERKKYMLEINKQLKHKVVTKERNTRYYIANREKLIQRQSEYHENYKHTEHYKNTQLNAHLKRTYKISLSDYESMVVRQNGVCAICGNKDTAKRRLSVDHDHKTGIIRELLCTKCNLVLGVANDNIDILAKMITYLNKWTQKA